MIILRILGSFLIIGVGLLLIKYSVRVTDATGMMDFAERWFKPPLAGTYTWWKLVGLGIMILGVLWMFGFLTFLPG